MNRYRVFDCGESCWMHIGYDTQASADRAAAKMNVAAGDPSRYRVIDQQATTDYSPDCPACLRGRQHTQSQHDAAVVRAIGGRS